MIRIIALMFAALALAGCDHQDVRIVYKTQLVLTPDALLDCPDYPSAPTAPSATQKDVAVFVQDTKLVYDRCRMSVDAVKSYNEKMSTSAPKE